MYVCVWWYLDLAMGGGEKNSGLKGPPRMDDTKKGEGGVNGWMDKHQKKENPTFRSWGWSCSEHLIAPFFLFFLPVLSRDI